MPAFSVLTTGGTRRVAELARDGRPLLVDLTEHGVVSAAMPDADEVRCVTHSRGGSASEPLLRVDLVLILLRSRRHRRRQR
ncbi:MAG: aromatic-ring hydroxylase C-terminal domain-containing protein [Mycobacterium sp.]